MRGSHPMPDGKRTERNRREHRRSTREKRNSPVHSQGRTFRVNGQRRTARTAPVAGASPSRGQSIASGFTGLAPNRGCRRTRLYALVHPDWDWMTEECLGTTTRIPPARRPNGFTRSDRHERWLEAVGLDATIRSPRSGEPDREGTRHHHEAETLQNWLRTNRRTDNSPVFGSTWVLYGDRCRVKMSQAGMEHQNRNTLRRSERGNATCCVRGSGLCQWIRTVRYGE